jgi:hypothetical protein
VYLSSKQVSVGSSPTGSTIKRRKYMKIAYSGTHGTGKSTKTFEKAHELKLAHTDKEVGIIIENARLCPLPINKKSTIESQLWIFGNQMAREIELSNIYDILVCDRTIFDAVAYSYVFGFNELAVRLFDLGRSFIDTYDEIILNTIEKNPYWFECGVRDAKDAKYREDVEITLKSMYLDLKNVYNHKFKFTIN